MSRHALVDPEPTNASLLAAGMQSAGTDQLNHLVRAEREVYIQLHVFLDTGILCHSN